MTKKNLILIVIILILIVIIGAKLINRNSPSQNGQIEERTNKIATIKKTTEYEIYNTDINVEGGSTKIKMTVKNISGKKTEQNEMEIVLLDEKENEIGKVKTIVPSLEKESVAEISAESLTIYENIEDFRILINNYSL